MNSYAYICQVCKAVQIHEVSENIMHCGKKMNVYVPLEQCTIAAHAEMVRSDATDDPCDDGRGQV